MLLENKLAIVTGAGRGLGKAIALTLGREGAKVAVFGRTLANIDQTASEIKAMSREALAIKMNVSQSAEVNDSMKKVLDRWGRIDILVNNAAVLPRTAAKVDPAKFNPFLDTPLDEWDEQIATDLTGVFYCLRAVIPPMIAQKSGRIINIGSLAGVNGGIFSTPSYTASKAGVIGMTKLAARWLGKYGINVNAVNPGPIMTEGAQFAPAQYEALASSIPFRRNGLATEALGKPQDIANAVLYLASDLSAYVTGTSLNVLGGQWLG
jgi:NAD(P)-dependent dehydrogenase (short-subunit alcohol dehydrogenase family)